VIFIHRVQTFGYSVAVPASREAAIAHQRRSLQLRASSVVLACVFVAVGMSGCGTLSRATRLESPSVTVPAADEAPQAVVIRVSEAVSPPAPPMSPEPPLAQSVPAEAPRAPEPLDSLTVAGDRFDDTVAMLAQSAALKDDDAVDDEYDLWERFNEKTFEFNRQLDRYVLKPVAKVYDKIMPDRLQNMISNGFDNIRFVPRLVNSLLQAKWNGAGRELGRFLINSTVGIGGLFDMAKQEFGIEKSREDFGQTLGVWGAGAGPYLVLPLLPPLTVRDAVGFFVDGAMHPLNYVLPFFWTRFGMQVGDAVNDRSLNLELYQGFEETVIDMYSAVRHGYLKRREQLIKE
jgi:phospholipid-binding lipoprotein MlaA